MILHHLFTYGDPRDLIPGLSEIFKEYDENEKTKGPVVKEMEINGCHVKLIFAEEPVDGVIEKVKEILAYDHNEPSKKLDNPA